MKISEKQAEFSKLADKRTKDLQGLTSSPQDRLKMNDIQTKYERDVEDLTSKWKQKEADEKSQSEKKAKEKARKDAKKADENKEKQQEEIAKKKAQDIENGISDKLE